RRLAFVDVPGHVRFIKNMLAGVGAVDACLFVVAATEGWKPQSEEHLRILELLGVSQGLIALTKVGSVDADARELARLELAGRVAVNVSGASRDRIARGHALVRPGQWRQSTTVDASLTVLAGLEHEVTRRGAYHAYVGSGEHPVRVRVIGADAIPPGGSGAVRLHLPAALPLLPGDRFVLRESGRAETVGGGEVLDVAPVLPASRAGPSRSADRVVAERGWVDAGELELLTGERHAPTVG